jgi:hypothetical protein
VWATRTVGIAAIMGLLVMSTAGPATADSTVHARLSSQNHSGVTGTATLTATSAGQLVVDISADGLMPGPHAQHIHGSAEGMQHHMCASMADDTDGDGVLTNEEGMGEYGTIFLTLTTRGDVSASSGLALDRMPVADNIGHLDYHRTIAAEDIPRGLLNHLSEMHVVMHGIDVNGNGRYDLRALGESTFAKSLGLSKVPEEATDPAACGVVTGAGASMSPRGGVETGGGVRSSRAAQPLLMLGVGLLAGSAILWRWRRGRTFGSER